MADTKILKSDWDRIHELAVDIVNASAVENEPLTEKKTAAILEIIDELIGKYGEEASLLSIKASYIGTDQDSIELLVKAYALAQKNGNNYTMAEAAWDLAHIYWDSLEDRKNAKLWNDRLGACLEQLSNDIWQADYDEMCRELA